MTNQLNVGGSLTIAGSITSTGNSPQVTVYTSGSGTYTVPTNARWVHIRMVGGGGGAGAYVEHFFTSLSTSYSYAVGAGGTGGTSVTAYFTRVTNGGSGIIIVMAYF